MNRFLMDVSSKWDVLEPVFKKDNSLEEKESEIRELGVIDIFEKFSIRCGEDIPLQEHISSIEDIYKQGGFNFKELKDSSDFILNKLNMMKPYELHKEIICKNKELGDLVINFRFKNELNNGKIGKFIYKERKMDFERRPKELSLKYNLIHQFEEALDGIFECGYKEIYSRFYYILEYTKLKDMSSISKEQFVGIILYTLTFLKDLKYNDENLYNKIINNNNDFFKNEINIEEDIDIKFADLLKIHYENIKYLIEL